jgi:hypothetical protein
MYHGKLPPDIVRNPLPDHPDLALFVGTLFERLGGKLEIDGQGNRRAHRPETGAANIPQMADAQPWEQFRSQDEWRGAIKLVAYWLERLGAADKERVFTLLAAVELGSEPGFDFRADL